MTNTHDALTARPARSETKVALITGASRGLGAAAAARLARDGLFVLINANRSRGAADELLAAIRRDGGDGAVVVGDVASVAGVRALWEAVDRALDEAGLPRSIDVLVANAGALLVSPFVEVSEADFDALFDLNVKGVFFLVQGALPRLRDGGRVITLGTGLTRVASPVHSAYAATKGAIDVLTRVWAQLLGPRGITVNSVAPGAIDTDMNRESFADPGFREFVTSHAALRRVGHADDIADVVAFLASDASRWVTAQRIEASGGYHL